jgi:hypothetical protein
MAHGHVHVFDLDGKTKLPVFNLQFMNKDEIVTIKQALDKVMPKDRNEVYTNLTKTVNDMLVNAINASAPAVAPPIAGAVEKPAEPKSDKK